jgi:uncharacterized protein YgiM (DUF1202 family)
MTFYGNGIKDDSFMRFTNQLKIICLVVVATGVLGCCCKTTTAQLVDDDLQFPYQAMVLKDKAEIRSGPGEVHYATGKLKQNSMVEVYRHDPGGWCAIRPVNGSFSLIAESAIEIIEDGIGRIVEDGTQAWVGTSLGPVDQALWQIKLKRGEKVEILGQANWPRPDGHSTIWYQIAPPAGEFRWINDADIQQPPTLDQLVSANVNRNSSRTKPRDTGETGSADLRRRQDSQVQPATYQSTFTSTPNNSSNGETAQSQPLKSLNQGWRRSTRPMRKSNDSYASTSSSSRTDLTPSARSNSNPDGFQTPLTTRPNWDSNARLASLDVNPIFDLKQSMANYDGRGYGTPGQPRNGLNSGAFNSLAQTSPAIPAATPLSLRLADIEMKLTNEMIKEPAQWRLLELRQAAKGVYDGTSDPLERLQAQKLLAKLDSCREISNGYQNVSTGTQARRDGTVGSGLSNANSLSLGTTYDATGWLSELIRDGGTSPSEYALKDANGKVTHHISPAPGINLHRYLKTKVGVIGKRGYHTGLKLNHVTVERIVDLQRN